MAVALSLVAVCSLLVPADASACGMFLGQRKPTKRVTVPSLQVENVLIVHDRASQTEHFVREIVFRDANEPFGFVVPTPSQPTVHEVKVSPFASLAKQFPLEAEPPVASGGAMRGFGGAAGGAAKPKVTVLSQERIGSFTAFVLAANDAAALHQWLEDNKLETPAASKAWLAHYVKLGFFFTAFRYEVPAKSGAALKSETVRLSFSTPLPYYPYKEPEHAPVKGPRAPARVLAVWLVSPEGGVPVAATRKGWQRPWAERNKHPKVYDSTLASALGELKGLLSTLPPEPPPAAAKSSDSLGTVVHRTSRWKVQTFEDQKRDRGGFGDVVFVPSKPTTLDTNQLGMRKLAASLDIWSTQP